MGSILEMLKSILGSSGSGSSGGGMMGMLGGGGSGVGSASDSFGVLKSDENSPNSGFMSQLAGSQAGTAKMGGGNMGSVGGQSHDMYGVSTSAANPMTMMSQLNNANPVQQQQEEPFDSNQLLSLISRLTGRG